MDLVCRARPGRATWLRRTGCRLRQGRASAPQKSKQQNHCANAIHGFFISHKDFLEQETAIQARRDESGTLLQNRAISFPNADDLSCHYHIPDC